MQGRQDPLECGFCITPFALQGLHCSVCPRVKKGKNEVLKSRLYWEWLFWRSVIAASEALSTFPL